MVSYYTAMRIQTYQRLFSRTHIYKTYDPFRADEATFLFTVLYILYIVRFYLQLHRIRYHAIILNKCTEL